MTGGCTLSDDDWWFVNRSRIILEMSLHVWLFYYISQSAINVQVPIKDDETGPHQYYMALLETLQFTEGADIDIAKHWCHVMQSQLYRMCSPIDHHIVCRPEKNRNERQRLLRKHGQQPPAVVRICGL